MEGPSLLAIAAPLLLLGLAARLARAYPTSWLGRLLLSEHGPSLDAARMTRHQCLRSAGGFGVIALLALATLWLLGWYATRPGGPGLDSPHLLALAFVYSIVLLMGIAGALYLSVRAPFRPRELPPAGTDAAETPPPADV